MTIGNDLAGAARMSAPKKRTAVTLFHGDLREGMTELPAGAHVGTLNAANNRIDRLMNLPNERRPDYAPRQGSEIPTVYPVNFAPQNPLKLHETWWSKPEIVARSLLESGAITKAEHDNIARTGDYISPLKRRGYDAIAYENEREDPGSTSYILLQKAMLGKGAPGGTTAQPTTPWWMK